MSNFLTVTTTRVVVRPCPCQVGGRRFASCAPYRVFSVVDWVLDVPYLVPLEHTQRLPAMYNVFAFGINDPSEATVLWPERTLKSLIYWPVISDGTLSLGQVRES